jgi:hypothetical protein
MSADELLSNYQEGVSVFHITGASFVPFTPLANVEDVKSVNYDPQTQHLVHTKAEVSWWTHHVFCLNPTRTFALPDINLYKARVSSP